MIGGLIGAIIGSIKGGFIGLIFGAFVGSQLEVWVSEKLLGNPSRKTRIQHAYFEALFTCIGKLAKIDGIITANEINKCEAIMQRMRLDASQRALAIKFFNKGKQPSTDINNCLNNFHRTSGRSYSIKQMFLEMLLEVATADNRINLAEWKFLQAICSQLHFPQQLLEALLRMRGFNIDGQYSQSRNHSQGQNRKWSPPGQPQKSNSYQILGVTESASKTEIRRAYKKLMSSHHPDKLIAKGLPPEMIEIAKNKTQDIQAAWENIKALRGF